MKTQKQGRACTKTYVEISLEEYAALPEVKTPETPPAEYSDSKQIRSTAKKLRSMCSKAYTEISLCEYVATLKAKTPATSVPDWHQTVEKNLGLVRSRIKLVRGVNPNNCDDLEQAGMIALINAAKGFDPSLGNQFSSYAVPAIDRAMRRELEHLNGRIATDSLDALQEDGDYTLGTSCMTDPDDIYRETEQQELVKTVTQVCKKLTRTKDIKAVKAIAMQICGASTEKIARAIGLSHRSCSAYISIGRQILSENPYILKHISLVGEKSHADATLLGEHFTITVEKNVNISKPMRSGSSRGFSLSHFVEVVGTEDVADYLLGEVPIGEEVVILDEDTKCATVLRMETDSVAITSVSRHSPSRSSKAVCA